MKPPWRRAEPRGERERREPAVARDVGRDPLAQLGLGLRSQRQREVRVCVDVDEARDDETSAGIDGLARRPEAAADGDDTAVLDRDVVAPDLVIAVDQQAARDEQVVHAQRAISEMPSRRAHDEGAIRTVEWCPVKRHGVDVIGDARWCQAIRHPQCSIMRRGAADDGILVSRTASS